MKKTNAKVPVKILQEPSRDNEHQKKMDEIANKMAILFEEKITASALAKWLVIANTHSDPKDDLIWDLGYEVLPGIIDAKTQADRINFLKKELPKAFEVYIFANRSLFQLAEEYFKKNKGLIYLTEQVEEFISIYLVLLSICEMFAYYENEEKELRTAA